MALSGDSGDSGLTGDSTFVGDSAIGGDSANGIHAGGAASAYISSALITTREGIVRTWEDPKQEPRGMPFDQEPRDRPLDDGEQMRRWEARVRAQVLDFVLLSSFRFEVDKSKKPAVAKLSVREGSLVELPQPSASYLRENQLKHVYDAADLRRDRAVEILSQIKGIETFFGSLLPLHPERHKFTFELLAAFLRATVSIEMRIKHALAVPRPVEFSWQIMPMIQTPGHGSFPAGHAAETFMVATILSALMKTPFINTLTTLTGEEKRTPEAAIGEANQRYAFWDDRLARLAARISVNRVIAGVHFPIDLAAGLVLGLAVGRYFVALAKGEETRLDSYGFVGEEAYADKDFPWSEPSEPAFPWAKLLIPTEPLSVLVATSIESVSVPAPEPLDEDPSPLRWLWRQAVEEWKYPSLTMETRHAK